MKEETSAEKKEGIRLYHGGGGGGILDHDCWRSNVKKCLSGSQ